MPTRQERIAGGLWGMLIGDAVGVPYEFHAPHELPPRALLEMTPPPGFPRAHARIPPGTWSDDGAQALALLDSLLTHGRLDLDDFAQRLLDWYQKGSWAVDHDVFDVGIQTRQALQNLMDGVPAHQAGPNHERANGNGSLMRVLPLALWHTGADADLVHAAHQQSLVTHGHLRAQVCCALYCLWARRILDEVPHPWTTAVASLRDIYRPDSPAAHELNTHIRPDDPPSGKGGGYVVDCLNSARLALEETTYEEVIKAAIALGDDTDTTACVAGGLAGLGEGVGAIPARWLNGLRGKELVQPLLEKLSQNK
ncbi:MAG: ADP-ribosylglycohydrolase family protein [Anaerolineales bacterium]